MIRAIGLSILWIAPYLVSGFSAPFIFKNAPTPQVGGHYAGALFVFAGVWSVFVSYKFQMPLSLRGFFIFVLCLQLLFWGWRFFDSSPLKESALLGLSGSVWHSLMTSLYLLVAVTLFLFTVRSDKVSLI